MTVRIALRHRIEQRFSRPVNLSTHWLRLRPAPLTNQRITAYSLGIDAEPHFINWVRDPFENNLARLDLPEPVSRLGFDIELLAELEPVNPFDFLVEPLAANFPFAYPAQLRKELAPYLALPLRGPRFAAWVETLDTEPAYILAFLSRVNQQIHESFAFAPPGQPGRVDPEAVLAAGAGWAWQVAWLGTLGLRALGLAARFVSGYRLSLDGDGSAAAHAWTEVYLPGAGWVGLDPARGLFTDECYLPLAAAPDPLRAVPVVGYREACEEQFNERVEVRQLLVEPEQWPFSSAEREHLDALGRKIDLDLQAAGVALNVQPGLAFVAATESDLDEWKIAALGPAKRRVAEQLMLRLRERLAPGGVLQVEQGEQFAGDPLPRWRLGCWARTDGAPVCRSGARIGWAQGGAALTPADARAFGERLAHALGIEPTRLAPAYEDGLYRRWLDPAPSDLIPDAAEISDPERRRALAERLSRESAQLRGYVLPLRWDAAAGRWASGTWPLRRGAIYLLPGDSPMGYRLPLEGLPLAVQRRIDPERCQFEDRALLPEVHGEVSARLSRVAPLATPLAKADQASAGEGPRTAVCAEIRDGSLHCFLPPLTHLEHYLELVAAVELAAESLDTTVVLEGYGPPEDHRLRRIVIEPDAGALRVRLPEAGSSPELQSMLRAAFDEAAACGLHSERVMPDGSRFPPGVGAPLALAGQRPVHSPFLRRPEILRSLIAYWQRHPCLSYLFAGRGIGASGLAPRVDEGRDEALYELAIALERLPAGEIGEPWLADRVLRHLLTDPAGDMRRAEIRVDELYHPVRASRRLGRITLGSFEMASAAELQILQVQLVRALVARFAQLPERPELRPWGTALQDSLLLPRVLWDDFCVVLGELDEAGYPFQAAWFTTLVEQRFPRIGRVQFDDIALELRQAHEPWPVLAEEVSAGGVARFIDSALDRVQVTASGLTPGRYILECNAETVPLQPTGAVGEYVAGVRYKASNPPATLHPSAPPVDALVFDLIDTWSGRVLGGFTYHPARPRGWGTVGVPRAGATGSLAGEPVGMRLAVPAGMPLGQGRGRFEPRGSGRRLVRTLPARIDPARPYLLDLSFPD
ncbi:MAG: transglutaminase family protein [Chromatiaceae bacterium]|nr:transglutaminase family protein [Chromatiaceae bacterium]